MLLIAGLLISAANIEILSSLKLTPSLVMFVFLPVLLFESAYHFNFRDLRKIIAPAGLLATLGLLVASIIIALGLNLVLGISIPEAMLFAAAISSTDPIAVLSIFKKLGVPKLLQLHVDAESFLNDATSVILFRFFSGLVFINFAGGSLNLNNFASEASLQLANFGYVFLGGILVGGLAGLIFSEIIAQIKNANLVEIALPVVLSGFIFILAEHFLLVSGIIAVLAAGLVMGNYGKTKFSAEVVKTMGDTWDFLVFIATTIIFILVGYEINIINLISNWRYLLLGLVLVYISRAVSVYLISTIYNLFQRNIHRKIPYSWMHISNWGGLRGVLPLAVLLSLPADFVYKDIFIQMTLGAIFFSMILNATTIQPLIKMLKLDSPTIGEQLENKITQILLIKRLIMKLDLIQKRGEVSTEVYNIHLQELRGQLEGAKLALDKALSQRHGGQRSQLKQEFEKVLRRHCLQIERMTYKSLFDRRVIREDLFKALDCSIHYQRESLEIGGGQFKSRGKSLEEKFRKFEMQIGSIQSLFKKFNYRGTRNSIEDTYIYYQARVMGDSKVLEELSNFSELDVELFGAGLFTRLKQEYQDLLEYNQRTTDEIRSSYKNLVLAAEEKFYVCESIDCLSQFIREYGDEELVSTNALKMLKIAP